MTLLRGAAMPPNDQVRAGDQPQDRQGVRLRHSADAARHRRRGDRMRERKPPRLRANPNCYPRSRSAVMHFIIIAIVALITTTAHAQGLVPYYGPDGPVY